MGRGKVLALKRGGFILLVIGTALGILIRPNEILVLMGGFAVALMIRPAGPKTAMRGPKRIVGLIVMGSLVALSVFLTLHYLHRPGGSLSLQQTNKNNSQGTGLGFGSSGIPYSGSLAYYWRDIYQILFDPLPFNSHGLGERVAALENTVILGLILFSLRNLRMVPRAAFARPYVMMCAVYSAGFIYAFAALGNLGLIERERVLLFPFLLVLLCIPRTPRRQRPRYEWEFRRRARRQRRAAIEARAGQGVPVHG